MFYKKYLNAKEIEARKKKFGFPNAKLIELLIYDYEIFRNLLEISNQFYLKGGAAAQLYMTLPEQRASKDIDVITSHTPGEIEEIFTKKLNSTFASRKHIPAKITHNIPMVTYLVEADSVTDEGKIEVKVDVMFEDINNYKLTKAQPAEIFALNTEVELPTISIGSLIGDKLLTLAHKSIGLPAEKLSEYPKQIYDIARIMKRIDKETFSDILFSFERIIQTELKIRELENTPEEIVSHIFEILDNFSDLDSPENLFKDYVRDFQSAYVNKKARKTNSEWIIDVLIMVFLLRAIRDVVIKKKRIDEVFDNLEKLNEEFLKISSLKIDDKKAFREKLLDELREKRPTDWKKYKSSSEERIFLELKRLEGEKILTLTDRLALNYLKRIEKFERIKTILPKDKPKLNKIIEKYITEKLSFQELVSEILKNFPYLNRWKAERIANTEPSKIQNLAILENLRIKGEKHCYVESSDKINLCVDCKRLIDGRVFNIKTLQDNVYANYVTKYPQYPSVPLHPNCKHKVRALSSDEKKKLPEEIPEKGFPIKF